MSDQVKISYNAALSRIRCEFTRQACLASEAPPADLIQRAKAKLEAVKQAGEIAFFSIYETRLNEAWRALREAGDEPEERAVHLTLGAGAPALPGIKVEKSTQEKAIASLTIDAGKDSVSQWRWEWFKLTVTRRLREAGIREQANNAQLFSAFTRARLGEKIQGQPIGATVPPTAPAPPGKAFSVIANKQRLEIGVVIRSVKELRSKANRDAMLTLVNQAVKHMSTDGAEYQVLRKDFLAALQSALEGPEFLGLELPMVLLAAVGHQKAAAVPPANYPGAGRINFEVTDDKMEAKIIDFTPAYYKDDTFAPSVEWIQNELKRCLVVLPMPEDVVKTLSEALKRGDDLTGMVACHGHAGTGGKEPYLHPAYQDAAGRSAGNLDEDSLDIREMQQRSTVKTGQLVAAIRYKKPATTGRNIYGDESPAPPNDELIIQVGDGIVQRENGRFFATSDGIPVIAGEEISLSTALVHEGDVNLRSGNIRFDGPVEIKGSVDSGAVVETTGDVIIHGSVRGGFVRSQGSVTVMAGITTGTTGLVRARGDVTADFIENSTILCGGTVRAGKALLNCQVYAGGGIEMTTKSGTMAGGRLFCRETLVAENLGFSRGAMTVLNVGMDWRAARSIDIKRGRLEKLQKRAQDDRLTLRELVQKKQAQTTQRHKEMKDELQERLTRLRTLCETLEAMIAKASAELTYNMEARISVKELLTTNVNVTVGGQIVAVMNDLVNVAILPKRRRGSCIVALEEIEAEEAKAAAPTRKKKAS